MRRVSVIVSLLVTALMGPVLPGLAQEQPPRGTCNSGTTNAHEIVPHQTEGNLVAHSSIPHCPEH